MSMGSADRSTAERASIILAGLIGSVALAQIASWNSANAAGLSAATAGGMLALVTFTAWIFGDRAWKFGELLATIAEWCYAGLALIALLPAILSLGDSCRGIVTPVTRVSVLIAFSLTWLVAATLPIAWRTKWSDLGKAGLNLFAFFEGVMFWSEPSWASASAGLIFGMALVAGIGCGALVGWSPTAGLLIISVALVLGSLLSMSGEIRNPCGDASHAENAAWTMLTYLVVFGFLQLGRKVLFRRM